MSAKFYTLLTDIGAAKLASAAALGVPLKITQMAVGDGDGVLPTPSAQQTALVAEKRRASLNMLYIDPQNSSQIIAEQVIPETEGGWWIREVGLFDDTGALIAVGNCPESYKPQLAEGSGRTQTVRMVLITSSTDNITLKIDPAVVLATRKYVDDKVLELKVYVDDLMAKHLAAVDPHSQYAPKDSPTLTGMPKTPTPPAGNNSTLIASTAFVQAAILALIGGAPATLDTLKEIAAAINNDPNFSTTINNALALKAPLASPALTGTPTAPTAVQSTNNTQIATTAFVKSAVAGLVGSSPEALDTLNELAAALGNDPNFATTVMNALAGKQPLDATLTNLSGKSVSALLQYLQLEETVKKADGAIQKSGGNMEGPLGLTRTSSFGVATENTLGGNSIAIGDSDSGFKSNGDGNIALMANSVLAGYFSENELQHHEKVLTKIFRAISTGNATEGAGGFGSQLTSGAPFYSPAIVRQNNDNNYFPLWKQIVSLQSGYPVAASMGLLTTGEPNFPQIVLHAKTDFEVNDKLWVFDVATGELRSPALIKAGGAVLNTNGDISGSAWGGALTDWLNSQLATRDANINARATVDWVNSQLATRDANINARATVDWVNSQLATRDANINVRATVDWVNSNFNKKNTATLGFSGWSRDESTGLIMQWGNVDNARGTYSFPRAFNDTCFAVFATNKDGQGGAIDNAYGYPVNKTQFYLASKANSGADTAYGISWFALGY
ncbi:phage tail protein [Enterobacter hormaechei]|uniref:phage tail protein n=8 Tax=Enterobacter hormaechei TaxID=158836 RepID=UPI0020CFFD61|nr:phage tail protein [Enterobacter hormaechei]